MQSLKRTVLFLAFIAHTVKHYGPTAANTVVPSVAQNHNLFASDIFAVIVDGKASENIVYSPISIQTCMALIFIGAEGETADEMRKVLRLGKGDKIHVAKKFGKFLKTERDTHNLTYEIPTLKMVSRLLVNEQLKVFEEFNKIAVEYFETQTEKVNFNDYKTVVENINQWVFQQTENKIKDFLKEDAVNSDTNAVMINAIHFKAKWLNAFSQSSTSISTFYINFNDTKEVEIMYNWEYYGYAELPELEATALEMPYNNSDISMLILLPNEVEGLKKLENKLKNKDLNEIAKRIFLKKVHVYLPKFSIEFEIDLKEPLEKMGLTTTFNKSANFKNLFVQSEYQSISNMKHKACLDVNEAGSEATAATFATLVNLSANFDEPVFLADHPFIFAIRNNSTVYFAGHVATL